MENEVIFEREVARFHATAIGAYNSGGGMRPIGPVVVSVVVRRSRRADGVEFAPTYGVEYNGRHQFGGFADHLPENLADVLRGMFANVAPIELDFEPFEVPVGCTDRTRRFAPAERPSLLGGAEFEAIVAAVCATERQQVAA